MGLGGRSNSGSSYRRYTSRRSNSRRNAVRRRATSRSAGSWGGGGGGGRPDTGGGGGNRDYSPSYGYNPPIRSSGTGRYSPPYNPPAARSGPVQPVQPPPPSIKQFLGGDSTYQTQLKQFANALAQFRADVTRRRGTLNTEFGLSKDALADQRVKDLELIEDDYGARGIIRSGLYGEAVGDYEEEYGKRTSDLGRRHKDSMAQLKAESNRYRSQNNLKKQEARATAIRRRAEKYGL